MAVWYEVEKSENGIYNFLECNWRFHDFSIDKIKYYRKEQIAELFMKFDELKGSVILRFIGVHAINIVIRENDYDAWLMGSTLILSDDNTFTWIDSDDLPDDIDKMKKYSTWIQTDRILWAVTDENGMPAELPSDKIDQTWRVFGKTEYKHFFLMEYSGDQSKIKELY